MAQRLRIALLIDSSRAYRRDLLRGIAAYARVHGPWSFSYHSQPLDKALPRQLRYWRGDGVIIRTEDSDLIQKVAGLNLPTVGEFGAREHAGIPGIDSDHQAVARLAADHLLERGFANFAYCGFVPAHSVEGYRDHFVEYLSELGWQIAVYEGLPPLQTAQISSIAKDRRREAALAAWLGSLRKPTGVLASNDMCALQVLNACGEYGIAVPDDVAVIGVDNDEVLCELGDPPLTSVDPNARETGYQVASLLHSMISDKALPSDRAVIKPKGVVARQSTNVTAIGDTDTALAMHFIRQHACDSISTEDVIKHVQLSRSTLERRFAKFVGRSPKAEIVRVQLERVKELLSTTDLPLARIAELTGFNYVEYMCDLFKRTTGQTPGQFRQESPGSGNHPKV